jgi:hypothetical protein
MLLKVPCYLKHNFFLGTVHEVCCRVSRVLAVFVLKHKMYATELLSYFVAIEYPCIFLVKLCNSYYNTV